MKKQGTERRIYTREFKDEAVALAGKREKPVSQVAVDLGVNESMLRRWMQEARDTAETGSRAFPGHGRPRDEETTRLRRENKALRSANEILKKSCGHLRANGYPVTVYKFIQANLETWTVTEMTALFGVSHSAYYRWAKYGRSSRRSDEDAELLLLIRGIVVRHKMRYGSPRVCLELRELHGKRVSRKRVARLMRENGLNARLE